VICVLAVLQPLFHVSNHVAFFEFGTMAMARVNEKMSWEQSAIFFLNLAYKSHEPGTTQSFYIFQQKLA
jgi:hypothetical protein